MPTDLEIFENRKTVISFLKQDGLQRATGVLQSVENPEARCCLGHMCVALDIQVELSDKWYFGEDKRTGAAPKELMEKVSLFGSLGEVLNSKAKIGDTGLSDLAYINDNDRWSFSEIAEYLEENILGGEDTVWKKIDVDAN